MPVLWPGCPHHPQDPHTTRCHPTFTPPSPTSHANYPTEERLGQQRGWERSPTPPHTPPAPLFSPRTHAGHPARRNRASSSATSSPKRPSSPLTFDGRRLQPLADVVHAAVGVVQPGDRLGAPQLHEVPELPHGAPEIPLMVAFGEGVPGVVIGHVVRHLAPAGQRRRGAPGLRGQPRGCGFLGRELGTARRGSLGGCPGAAVPLAEPFSSGCRCKQDAHVTAEATLATPGVHLPRQEEGSLDTTATGAGEKKK